MDMAKPRYHSLAERYVSFTLSTGSITNSCMTVLDLRSRHRRTSRRLCSCMSYTLSMMRKCLLTLLVPLHMDAVSLH